MANSYRELAVIAFRGIRTLRGYYGERFVGVVFGLMPDAVAQGATEAVRSPWFTLASQPDDALPLLGQERRLDRYPPDTSGTYRARQQNAWNLYQFTGSADDDTMLTVFAAMGLTLGHILDIWNSPGSFADPTYWSQFIVSFDVGGHPVTAVGPAWGSFSWGDGTRYGPVGLTLEMWANIRHGLRKWKPSDWICRKVQFQLASGPPAEIAFF
jgi:hypothetical protein